MYNTLAADAFTLNVLEDFLMEYPGVLILASHDRYMLDKLADHLFILEGDGVIKDYPGGYTSYTIWKQSQEEEKEPVAESKMTTESGVVVADRQDVRKALRRAEKVIEQLTQKKKTIEENFLTPEPRLDDLQRWDRELKEINLKLLEAEHEWLELSEKLETY